jgi:hypothetical protein
VNKIKEILDSKVFQIIKLLERPLPIEMTSKHSELLTVIQKDVENLRESARDNKAITYEIAQFSSRNSAAVHNSSVDFLLSSLTQDNIINRSKTHLQLKELKNLILRQHQDSEERFSRLSTDLTTQQDIVKDKLKSIKNLYEQIVSSETRTSKQDKNLIEEKEHNTARKKEGAPHLYCNKREERLSPSSYEEPN